MNWTITEQEPTGQSTAYFWDKWEGDQMVGGFGGDPIPTYTKTEENRELRRLRTEVGMTLGDMCRMTGLPLVQVAGLEQGSYQIPPDEWKLLFDMIKEWHEP